MPLALFLQKKTLCRVASREAAHKKERTTKMSKYVEKVLKDVQAKNANEPEFIQAVDEVLTTLDPVLKANPVYEKNAILERMVEPERIVMFRVPWVDDKGIVRVNRGYRIQMNSAIGPYKGGRRFDPTVNLSVLKFLAFE